MLTEILNSIKATLYDRTSSPLFGSFAVSWAVWNYRVLIVLVGDGTFDEKIKYVDGTLYPTWWHVAGLGVAAPLTTALAYIFLYPWPARRVYEFTATQQKRLRDLRKKIEGDELVSVEEARELRHAHVSMQIDFDRQIKSLQTERDTLRQLLEKRTEEQKAASELLAATNKERDEIRAHLLQTQQRAGKTSEGLGDAVAEAKRKAQRTVQVPSSLRPEDLEDTVWRLTFDPETANSVIGGTQRGTKRVHLLKNGEIGEGKNRNENKWRVDRGELEFVQADGAVHSRFILDRTTGRWESVADPSFGMTTPRQYMSVDPDGG